MSEISTQSSLTTRRLAKVVYILNLLGFFCMGITSMVGVTMAYINKADAPDWLKTHYHFQIRTFWLGLFYLLLLSIILPILVSPFTSVGALFILVLIPWWVIRSLKGINALELEKQIENPTRWLF